MAGGSKARYTKEKQHDHRFLLRGLGVGNLEIVEGDARRRKSSKLGLGQCRVEEQKSVGADQDNREVARKPGLFTRSFGLKKKPPPDLDFS